MFLSEVRRCKIAYMRRSQRTGPLCRLYSYIYPARNSELLKQLQARKLTVIGAPHHHPSRRSASEHHHGVCLKMCALFNAVRSGDPMQSGWLADYELACARHGLHPPDAEVRPAPLQKGHCPRTSCMVQSCQSCCWLGSARTLLPINTFYDCAVRIVIHDTQCCAFHLASLYREGRACLQ